MNTKKIIPIIFILFLFFIVPVKAAANLNILAFACNPNEVEINQQFSCTATVQNTGDATGTVTTLTLFPDSSNWLESASYATTANVNINSGSSSDIVITGLKGKKTGNNGFSRIMLDDTTDTFVSDNGIKVNVIDVLVVTSSSISSGTTGTSFTILAQATVGGNVNTVLSFSGTSGCSLGNQQSSVTTNGLSNGQITSHTWTVTLGSSSCTASISAQATSRPSGVAVKTSSESKTITCTSSGCSSGSGGSSSGSSSGGGGGGGGGGGSQKTIAQKEKAVTFTQEGDLTFSPEGDAQIKDFKFHFSACKEGACTVKIKTAEEKNIQENLRTNVYLSKKGIFLGALELTCQGTVGKSTVSYTASDLTCGELRTTVVHTDETIEDAPVTACTQEGKNLKAISTFNGCSYFIIWKTAQQQKEKNVAVVEKQETKKKLEVPKLLLLSLVFVIIIILIFALRHSKKKYHLKD